MFRVVSLRGEVSRRTKEPLLQPLVILEGLPQRVFHLSASTRRKTTLWVELCLPSPHCSIGTNEIKLDATSSPAIINGNERTYVGIVLDKRLGNTVPRNFSAYRTCNLLASSNRLRWSYSRQMLLDREVRPKTTDMRMLSLRDIREPSSDSFFHGGEVEIVTV